MRSTVIASCDARNCVHCAATEHGSRRTMAQTAELARASTLREQRTAAAFSRRDRSQADERSGETRARYDIDPGYTIGGVVVLVGMMFLSIGLVMGAGLMKTFGAR